MKHQQGDILSPRKLKTVNGDMFNIPDNSTLTHLNFRRYVDCPICNVHIGRLIKRAGEIKAAGIREVIFFHSSPEVIRSYQKDVPFVLVGDPNKDIYREFGVESSLFSLSPKAFLVALQGSFQGHQGLRRAGGPFGLPADLLVDQLGVVKAVKYGKHAADQWSVDELLQNASGAPLI